MSKQRNHALSPDSRIVGNNYYLIDEEIQLPHKTLKELESEMLRLPHIKTSRTPHEIRMGHNDRLPLITPKPVTGDNSFQFNPTPKRRIGNRGATNRIDFSNIIINQPMTNTELSLDYDNPILSINRNSPVENKFMIDFQSTGNKMNERYN